MTTTNPTIDLLDRYHAWKNHRAELFDHEAETGHFPEPDAMFHSDDTAVDLLNAVAPILAALAELVELDPEVWWTFAPQMTCHEAEAFATLLDVIRPDDALQFRLSHADGDDDDNDYHRGGWPGIDDPR